VVEAGHSMVGRIGSHVSLWVPRWDSVVRSWGKSLHGLDMESYGGARHVAPEAMFELKVQTEAKFHMYCFVLC
jgi:hypothetical protein